MARRVALAPSISERNLDVPELSGMVIRKLLQLAALQHLSPTLLNFARRRLPHHAGTTARILEAFDQRLDHWPASLASARGQQLPLQRIHHRDAEIEALDALRGPVGGDFIARH